MTPAELTRDEIIDEFSRVVRKRLGEDMDPQTVLALYRRGLLDGSEIADALILADLLPADDPFVLPARDGG